MSQFSNITRFLLLLILFFLLFPPLFHFSFPLFSLSFSFPFFSTFSYFFIFLFFFFPFFSWILFPELNFFGGSKIILPWRIRFRDKGSVLNKFNFFSSFLVDLYVSLSWFFSLPGSGSTFPEVDPDPAKWYGSNRILIRNTCSILTILVLVYIKFPKWNSYFSDWIEEISRPCDV